MQLWVGIYPRNQWNKPFAKSSETRVMKEWNGHFSSNRSFRSVGSPVRAFEGPYFTVLPRRLLVFQISTHKSWCPSWAKRGLWGRSDMEARGAKREQCTDSWGIPDRLGALTCQMLCTAGNAHCWSLGSEGGGGFRSRRAWSLSPLLQGSWKPITCSTTPATHFLGSRSCITAAQGKLSGAST